MRKLTLILAIMISLFLQFSCSKEKEESKPVEVVKEVLTEKVEIPKTPKQPEALKKEIVIVKADDVPTKGGVLYASVDNGKKLILPLKKTDVDINVTSGIVQANVTQTYTNDTHSTLEAIYIFPLPSNATVTDMELRVGNRIIKSEVQEKKAAKRTYTKAKREGRKTALLEQTRENIFKTSVANFHPGETVEVSFSYIEKMQYKVGEYEVNFPMVVGQRYIPFSISPDDNSNAKITSDVKDAQDLNPPLLHTNTVNAHFLSINVDVNGLPIKEITSSTHSIKVEKRAPQKFIVRLTNGATIPDCDFNIKLKLQSDNSPQITNLSSIRGTDSYGMTTVFPPTKKLKQKSVARDVIFLIDTSGSMRGSSIGQAKEGLKLCMDLLKPEDKFTIVRFASEFSYFSPALREVNADKIQSAKGYVNTLQAGGGTEMQKALDYVLGLQLRPEAIPMIVFLTDGCVGNEDTLFRLLNNKLGNGRLFTFGIGSAPNEHLMRKMAEIGRGQSRFIRSHEDIGEVMSDFFRTLENPVLTDIKITWKEKGNSNYTTFDHYPKKCPDVFYERPLQIFTKRPLNFRGMMRITGKLNGQKVNYDFAVDENEKYPAIEKMYAREQINDIQYKILKTRNEPFLRKDIIQIALEHQLVTNYTSRVAVEYELKEEMCPDGNLRSVKVPVNLPKGWDPKGFHSTATNNVLLLLIGFPIFIVAFVIRFLGR